MAVLCLGSSGTESGPCQNKYQHQDCAESRRMAAKNCIRCGEHIGYDRRFLILREGGLAHAVCEEEFQEQARKTKMVLEVET